MENLLTILTVIGAPRLPVTPGLANSTGVLCWRSDLLPQVTESHSVDFEEGKKLLWLLHNTSSY